MVLEIFNQLISNPGTMILLSTGIVLWIIFFLISKNQPKKINNIYGYRTKQSMKSQERWDFAQLYSTRLMIRSSILMCLVSLFFQYSDFGHGWDITLSSMVLLLLIFAPIYFTERALRQNFRD